LPTLDPPVLEPPADPAALLEPPIEEAPPAAVAASLVASGDPAPLVSEHAASAMISNNHDKCPAATLKAALLPAFRIQLITKGN
jgi:hypothetical protein